jgi:polyisoprenoid-binding protein YceI
LHERNGVWRGGDLPYASDAVHVRRMTLTRWILDPMHSAVTFSVRHLLVTNVRGAFDRVSGVAFFDPRQRAYASISVEIPAASIDTHQAQRDEHLRSADFFDVARHPTITFHSVRLGESELAGELTIRGITRDITLRDLEITGEQKDHRGAIRIGASASARVKRSEFGMTYNRVIETGGVAIADDVIVALDLSLVKDA